MMNDFENSETSQQPSPPLPCRLGIYGGTFDPVHYGHLLLAETCREACQLDEVWFVPSAVTPHKQDQSRTPAKQRIEMLELAIAGHTGLKVSTIEIDRGGVSFTVDTLTAIRESQPAAELFFLMGADSLHDFPTWRLPAKICEIATLLVVSRAGSLPPDFEPLKAHVVVEGLTEIRTTQVEMPIVELSSSDIRRRVAAKKSIRFRTPRAVEKYIETERLYLSK